MEFWFFFIQFQINNFIQFSIDFIYRFYILLPSFILLFDEISIFIFYRILIYFLFNYKQNLIKFQHLYSSNFNLNFNQIQNQQNLLSNLNKYFMKFEQNFNII